MGYTPPYLEVSKIGANTYIYPTQATTSTLRIQANPVDTRPRLDLDGLGDVTLYLPNGLIFRLADNTGSTFLECNWVTPDAKISTATNYNLFLNPNGTGKVKFGTFTSDATVTQAGYITILDAAGTTRYLSCITP